MIAIVTLFFVIFFFFVIKEFWFKNRWLKPEISFPNEWRRIILKKVVFYNALSEEEKKRFEYKVHEFLLNCRVTGINVSVDVTDKLLIAASAVIPIFEFPEWKYNNIQ